jgi:hypothetical protein
MWAKSFSLKHLRMKNITLTAIAALFAVGSAMAQTDTTRQQRDSARTWPVADTAVRSSATSSTSNMAKLDDNLPAHLKGVTSSTIQPKHYLPVLGTYATADGGVNLNLVVDSANMGIVWVEGLPQGRIKGLLKKAPGTYKIPAQKSSTGKAIAEGTLVYDVDTKQLQFCTGCTYNEANPAAAFTGKKGVKVWQLNKSDVAVEPVNQNQQ